MSTVILNGRTCCLLDLPCCIPPPGMTREEAQIQAVTEVMTAVFNSQYFAPVHEAQQGMHAAVAALLSHVDLVPKGVGTAVLASYGKWLVKVEPTHES